MQSSSTKNISRNSFDAHGQLKGTIKRHTRMTPVALITE